MGFASAVEFKGTKDGIVLQFLEHAEIETIIKELRSRIQGNSSFFKGASVIGTEGAQLDDSEKAILSTFLEQELHVQVISLDQYIKKTFVKVENAEPQHIGAPSGVFDGLEEGYTKFIRGTMRSGKSAFSEGNLVVLGDINPGAEVVAYGNIVIMGTLKGVAHAGANGNDHAYVVAYRLKPTQLRISRMITRAPDDSVYQPTGPEMAYIKDDYIVIEPYL